MGKKWAILGLFLAFSGLSAQTDTAQITAYDPANFRLEIRADPDICERNAHILDCKLFRGAQIQFFLVSVVDTISGDTLTDFTTVTWHTDKPQAVDLDSISGQATVLSAASFRVFPMPRYVIIDARDPGTPLPPPPPPPPFPPLPPPGETGGESYFSDDFSSGNLLSPTGAGSWGVNAGPPDDVSVTTTNPYPGDTHSVEFTFAGNADLADDAWAELRFTLDDPQTELWIEYYLYVPDGTEGFGSARFFHRNPGGSDNNKFLITWGESYGGPSDSPKMLFEFRYSRATGPGDSFMHLASTSPETGVVYRQTLDPAITDAWRGRWNQIRVHGKVSSSLAAEDGIIQLWHDGVLIMSVTDAQLYTETTETTPHNYWRHGYLLGWANSGYTDTTKLFIARPKFFVTDPGWLDTDPLHPNMPAGMTQLAYADGSVAQDVSGSGGSAFGIPDFGPWFERTPSNWWASPGTNVTVVDDADNPTGSGKAVRFFWDAAVNGAAVATLIPSGGPWREVYIAHRVVIESGWSPSHKWFYHTPQDISHTAPYSSFTAHEANGVWRWVDAADAVFASPSGALDARDTELLMEMHIVSATTPSGSDGQVYMWLNGVLVAWTTSARISSAPSHLLDVSRLHYYAVANSVPSDSYFRVREFGMWGKM